MFFSSAHLSMFYILYLESKLKFCVKTWMGSILLSGLRDQNFGKMGLRDQNNGKKIGINGSCIYHVTTLNSSHIGYKYKDYSKRTTQN